MSTYCIPDSAVGPGDSTVDKTDKVLALMEGTFQKRKDNKHSENYQKVLWALQRARVKGRDTVTTCLR